MDTDDFRNFRDITRSLLQQAWVAKKEVVARARTTGDRVGETHIEHIEVGPEGYRIRLTGNPHSCGVVPVPSIKCRDAVTAADLLHMQRIGGRIGGGPDPACALTLGEACGDRAREL